MAIPAPWRPLDASTDTGSTLVDLLNDVIPTLYSTSRNAGRPPGVVVGQLFLDTTNANLHKLMIAGTTAAADVEVGSIDTTTNKFNPAAGHAILDNKTTAQKLVSKLTSTKAIDANELNSTGAAATNTFAGLIDPQKGIKGRTDGAPKAGEIGETVVLTYGVRSGGWTIVALVDFTAIDAGAALPTLNKGVWIFCVTSGVAITGGLTAPSALSLDLAFDTAAPEYAQINSTPLTWGANQAHITPTDFTKLTATGLFRLVIPNNAQAIPALKLTPSIRPTAGANRPTAKALTTYATATRIA